MSRRARLQWRHSPRVGGDRRAAQTIQPSTRQSCDGDYNTRKESADAAENQNIVDSGHGLPKKSPGKGEPGL